VNTEDRFSHSSHHSSGHALGVSNVEESSVIRRIAAPLFLALFGAIATAQEPIRFARTPDISPDGKLVAFSYLGDIWVVEAIGGVARPVTMHEAHDVGPVFSPDGRWIAFSSNRHGQYDVFVSPSYGGKARRLTFDSAHDSVTGWTPDGKGVTFFSTRTTTFPPAPVSYVVPLEGGQEKNLPFLEAKELTMAAAGNPVAFVRGPGTWYRKNYRGASNDDIWLANSDGSNVRRLSEFSGQDTSPMFSPDGRKLYYVTELHGGQANIVCQELSGSTPPVPAGSPKPLTNHRDDSVRKARISGNGDWIVYECGGDLWVVSTRDGSSRKLAIEVHADEKANSERTITYTRDMSEYALSPDESAIAFVVHGEVFVMPQRGGKANRLTDTPAVEHGLAWSPDSKKLIFVSDRSGYEELYLLDSDDPESPDLTKASRFKTKALTNTPEAEFAATFTPDGTRIAYICGGKMWTMKPDGTDAKLLIDKAQVFDYDWSPDGKWIVYSRADGSFASELYIMPTDGSKPPVNVTRYATFNADVSWAAGKLAFLSQRRSGTALHVLSLQKPSTATGPGAAPPAPGDIDWDDIHLRVERIGPPASQVCISKNGRMVAFRSSTGGNDLWVAAVDGSSVTRLTSGSVGPSLIRWTKGGTIYFLDGAGSLRTATPGLGSFGMSSPPAPGTINFTAKLTVRQGEEFTEMFDQSWRLLSETFYDSKHHGADWKSIREKYRGLVRHVSMKEDLYNLVSLMLGELNASHLGISGNLRFPEETTADLGLLFDETHKGPGLKIAEVLKRGPADKRGLNLKAGDIILAIDRTEITDKVNLSKLLNAKVNENVLLEVTSNPADRKAKRKVETQAVGRDRIGQLMYDRWVRQNAEAVARQSGGKVGYIHIRGMDDDGVEQFVRALYSDNFDKEGIIIDVRYNGGGFTHDQVLNYLGAKEHTFFRQRDGGEGLVMRQYDRKWTRPSTVLVNNRSYSDAEIFPAAYRAMGLGKVVGQPTGGMVIGTMETRLIDGSSFRLPRTGVFTARGVNMEKEGVTPDVIVDALPEELAKGNDPQLKKAIEVLSLDVAEWKKAKTGIAAAPGSGSAPTTPSTPTTAPK
jgi:tricorn protease